MSNDPKDFPYPLDTDLEEQVPVKKVVVGFDEKGRPTASIKTVMQKETVRYMNVPQQKIRCAPGQHFWSHFNKPKWLFGCSKCRFVVKVYPSTHKVDLTAGTIQNIASGRFL